MRPSMWKGRATASTLSRSPPEIWSRMPDHVQPGDTAFTRMPSAARSSAALRVSCSTAALVAG